LSDAIGFAQRPLPFYLRIANRLAPGDFTPERLMARAARSAGLPAEFPAHVATALDVLCAALREEARLHWFGATNLRLLLVTGLASFLRVEQRFREDPALADTPLRDPIIVTGLPRSGTTHLHRLLSAEPEAAPVRLYQHVYPTRFRPLDYRRLRTEVEFFPWRLASRTYDLDAIHYVRPGLPDECNFGMRLGGRSMIYWAMAPTYSYLEWLLAQDLRETYQLYRKVLILRQLEAPGRRITLKCPHHLAWLPALTEAIPEARIVMTHRDPLQAVPSECKLVLALQGVGTRALDWRRTVAGNMSKVLCFARRAVEFDAAPERLMHVSYRRLVRDPVETVRAIHARFGLPFEDAHATAIGRFAEQNRQHKHGRNVYSAEQFGVDLARVTDDYAPYRERFQAWLDG
jgi:hypothetical protein